MDESGTKHSHSNYGAVIQAIVQRRIYAPNFPVLESTLLLAGGTWFLTAGYNFLSLGAIQYLFWLAIPLFFLTTYGARPISMVLAATMFLFLHSNKEPVVLDLGILTMRYSDTLLGLSLLFLTVRGQLMKHNVELLTMFRPVFIFLLVIGISLINVSVFTPDGLETSAVSFTRLIATILLGPVIFFSVSNEKDFSLLSTGVVLLILVSTLSGVIPFLLGSPEANLGTRVSNSLGTNDFGVVSGTLVVYYFVRRQSMTPRELLFALLMFAIGLFGLYLSKSVGSLVAAVVTVSIYLGTRSNRRIQQSSLLKWVSVAGIASLVLFFSVLTIRPEQIRGVQQGFSSGTASARLMLAYAGFLIFVDHPLGVGWIASTDPTIIGDPELHLKLTERFPKLQANLFPLNGLRIGFSAAVHNVYIQFLAELGVIGLAVFFYAARKVRKGIVNTFSMVPKTSPIHSWLMFYVFGVIYILVKWNSTPLFGKNLETSLLVIFLAAIAVIAKLSRQPAEPDSPQVANPRRRPSETNARLRRRGRN